MLNSSRLTGSPKPGWQAGKPFRRERPTGAGEGAPTSPFMNCLNGWCFTACMPVRYVCTWYSWGLKSVSDLQGLKFMESRSSRKAASAFNGWPISSPLISFFRTKSHSVAQDGYDSLGWHRTHGNPLASVLWVLALQVWVTMPTLASFTAIQKPWSPPKIPGILAELRWQLSLCTAQRHLYWGMLAKEFISLVLGTEPKPSHMLGKHPATELRPRLKLKFWVNTPTLVQRDPKASGESACNLPCPFWNSPFFCLKAKSRLCILWRWHIIDWKEVLHLNLSHKLLAPSEHGYLGRQLFFQPVGSPHFTTHWFKVCFTKPYLHKYTIKLCMACGSPWCKCVLPHSHNSRRQNSRIPVLWSITEDLTLEFLV